MKKKLFLALLSIAATAFFYSPASIRVFAQTATATPVGRTADEAGAALPGVKITLTQSATGQTRTVITDESGVSFFCCFRRENIN